MRDLMVIGEFAARSRLSHKALRLYADRSLLEPAHVDPRTRVRYYRSEQVEKARLITLLRAIGMPLRLIGPVLDAEGGPAADLVAAYWQGCDREHRARRPLAVRLQSLLNGTTTASGTTALYPIAERDVRQQQVVFVQHHVTADRLPAFLGEAVEQLFAHLRAAGAPLSGPVFALHHGVVDQDGNGPIEVCAPTDAPVGPAGHIGVRLEPAHRQAYTELSKGLSGYATMAGAFEALAAWLDERGLRPSASAREIYYPNWSDAGPDEHVVDVAVPFRTGHTG
ncbi:MerR family transcriptional regulator [Kitasatospora sp. NPDC058218]|uniref:MerR family transcriptional regulator n=1 Tax=Kitasatospora sp. NPDC058218 TaxID=3346385 RepID=UPI0036DE3559